MVLLSSWTERGDAQKCVVATAAAGAVVFLARALAN
jgi:hypothetical protein